MRARLQERSEGEGEQGEPILAEAIEGLVEPPLDGSAYLQGSGLAETCLCPLTVEVYGRAGLLTDIERLHVGVGDVSGVAAVDVVVGEDDREGLDVCPNSRLVSLSRIGVQLVHAPLDGVELLVDLRDGCRGEQGCGIVRHLGDCPD